MVGKTLQTVSIAIDHQLQIERFSFERGKVIGLAFAFGFHAT